MRGLIPATGPLGRMAGEPGIIGRSAACDTGRKRHRAGGWGSLRDLGDKLVNVEGYVCRTTGSMRCPLYFRGLSAAP
jgi:hypothetical protein